MPSMVAKILELANANEARMQSGYVSAITSQAEPPPHCKARMRRTMRAKLD